MLQKQLKTPSFSQFGGPQNTPKPRRDAVRKPTSLGGAPRAGRVTLCGERIAGAAAAPHGGVRAWPLGRSRCHRPLRRNTQAE